ncbi:MAG: nucleoside triphosphate pyrophosphohydrolase [Armatimonadota bacterium]
MKIIGLGPGGRAGLSLGAFEALREHSGESTLFLRTVHHPTADVLRDEGIRFSSFDHVYDSAGSIQEVYRTIADALLERARKGDKIAYAVPGHPLVAEKSVELILQGAAAEGIPVDIVPSPSFVDACLEALKIPLDVGLQLVDAQSDPFPIPKPHLPALIFQVDDRDVASRVKLALLDIYPENAGAFVVKAAGVPQLENVVSLPLYKLDRIEYDHLCSIYVPSIPQEKRRADWEDFVEVVRRLRAPDGCPWDREQTHKTLRKYLLEETYEAVEAIDQDDMERLCEELGDVLLQVALHSQMASEIGVFDIRDVIEHITKKLIRRHPHVFGGVPVTGAEEVLENWERIKASESSSSTRRSVLDGVPKDLPALMKALEVSKRVVKVGFEWERLEDLWEKLHEELGELKQAVDTGETERIHSEVGDLIFTIVNVARWLKVDPEEALRVMVDRFIVRFRYVEDQLSKQGRRVEDASLSELDALWNEAKKALP